MDVVSLSVDETDLMICGMLIQNARLTYREMADVLGISLQAVHKRMQLLQQTGVIAGFHTFLSISYLDAVVVHIMGTSGSNSMDQVVENHEPIIITRQKGQAVVMMSLEDFNAYEETAYLLGSPANAARPIQSTSSMAGPCEECPDRHATR